MLGNVLSCSAFGGEFYFVTDDGAYYVWDEIDDALQQCDSNITLLRNKLHLNKYFLYLLAYIGLLYTKCTGKFVKITPFSVRMMTMNRYFNINKIKKELEYRPLVQFEDGWKNVVHSVASRMKSKQNQ